MTMARDRDGGRRTVTSGEQIWRHSQVEWAKSRVKKFKKKNNKKKVEKVEK